MNLILGVAAGYKWQDLKIFIKSIRKYFDDEVVLILNNPDTELIEGLKKYSIKYENTNILPKESFYLRYKYYYNFLKQNKFENILITDTRDVFFQDNPFNFDYSKELNFFLEDEIIENSTINSKWIKRTVGKKGLDQIKKNKISCCGQVIGNYAGILDYCDKMKNKIIEHKYKPSLHSLFFRRKIFGWDQGIHNYLVHSNFFKNIDFFDNEHGDIATIHYSGDFNFDDEDNLLNKNKKKYSIVHQYDRFPSIFEKSLTKFL